MIGALMQKKFAKEVIENAILLMAVRDNYRDLIPCQLKNELINTCKDLCNDQAALLEAVSYELSREWQHSVPRDLEVSNAWPD